MPPPAEKLRQAGPRISIPVRSPAPSRCANQALPCGPSRTASADARGDRGCLRQSALPGEVAPGRLSRVTGAGAAPTAWRSGMAMSAVRRARRASGNAGAIPTKPRSTRRASPKVRPGSRCRTRVKMSPLRVAQRVPPAAAVMVDDQDFALAAAVFEAAAGALRAVEPPDRRQPLQQRGAAHAGLQPFNLCVLSCIAPPSFGIGRAGRERRHAFPFPSARPCPPATAKPARGKGVRSTGAHSATHPCGAPGASGSAV